MAVGGFTINDRRDAVVDFTYPLISNHYAMMVPKPKRGGSSMFRVFNPLSPIVWLLVVLSILGFAVLFHGVMMIWRKTQPAVGNIDHSDHSFIVILIGIYSYFVEQSVPMNLNNMANRCILAVWMLFCILITTAYTSQLICSLTVSDTKPTINTVKDLANSKTTRPLTFPGSSVISFFQVLGLLYSFSYKNTI